MLTIIMTFKINKPYAEWKSVYERESAIIANAKFEVIYVGHSLEDDSKCYWIVRVPSMEALDAFFKNEEVKSIMIESGHIVDSTEIVACSA